MGFAQEVQWASRVVEVSSEASAKSFSARQLLGSPNCMPQGGVNPTSWTPASDKNGEFIKVAFEKPVKAKQFLIAENHNPGAIQAIYWYDKAGKEYLLTEFEVKASEIPSRLLSIKIDGTETEVYAVKLVLAGKKIKGFHCIDAIGISETHDVFTPLVNVVKEVDLKEIPERMSASINSKYQEIGPMISPDGKRLYFSRRFHPENMGGKKDVEDIWYSEFNTDKNEWSDPVNADKPLNTKGFNFVSSIIEEGNTLVLGNVYGKKGRMYEGISLSHKVGNSWTQPEEIKIPNENNVSDKANYFMGASGKVLMSAVERDDSYGNRDLYISVNENGNWTEPLNLGASVNTAAEDYAPFLAADERTLYFSTSGFPGYGNDDIFVTRRIGESWTNWTTPENLGSTINTKETDNYFTLTASASHAYFTSNILAADNFDIFRVLIPENQRPNPIVIVKGKVLDQKTKQPLDATIRYEDLSSGKEMGIVKTDPSTGEYEILLPLGHNYGYRAEVDHYFAINEHLDLTKQKDFKEVSNDLFVVEEKVGEVIMMNNIFFDLAKFELKGESAPELNRIAAFLTENANAKIEIGGHADKTGSSGFNKKLSFKRAEAVKKYLVRAGVPASKIDVKAYGEEKPVADNVTDAGRAKNRRVEFILIEK